MLDHNSGLKPVNYVHEIFTPGEILEIDQTSGIDMLLSGYYEVALEYLEPVEDTEEVKEIEIPMFNKGDVVKDKFGNLYVIEDLVSPQQLEQDSLECDHMGYRLKIIEKILQVLRVKLVLFTASIETMHACGSTIPSKTR